ncbi:hypothetical protein SynBIOSE41_02126 [Synechococcus sp. BIOS-E4-1]|nr:hypothetical protein SynBIOSE41_02126 [Synechococcus sp. BIOS-E4-1]
MTGAFIYFFNLANNPTNQHSIPGMIEHCKYKPKTHQNIVAITF